MTTVYEALSGISSTLSTEKGRLSRLEDEVKLSEQRFEAAQKRAKLVPPGVVGAGVLLLILLASAVSIGPTEVIFILLVSTGLAYWLRRRYASKVQSEREEIEERRKEIKEVEERVRALEALKEAVEEESSGRPKKALQLYKKALRGSAAAEVVGSSRVAEFLLKAAEHRLRGAHQGQADYIRGSLEDALRAREVSPAVEALVEYSIQELKSTPSPPPVQPSGPGQPTDVYDSQAAGPAPPQTTGTQIYDVSAPAQPIPLQGPQVPVAAAVAELAPSGGGASGSIKVDETYREYGRNNLAGVVSPSALPYISRRHFAIYVQGGQVYIQDLGSTNGTFVNGRDIRGMGPVRLNPGDVVNLGTVAEFRLVSAGPTPAQPGAPGYGGVPTPPSYPSPPPAYPSAPHPVPSPPPPPASASGSGAGLLLPSGRRIAVTGELVLGRNDFRGEVPQDSLLTISRTHLRVRPDPGGGLLVMDEGSTNGTFVNGRDIRGSGWVRVKPGDRVSLAGVLEMVVYG